MALHERVKTALDETRTLILGAQILLGFQYQGVFQERFEALPPHARAMDGWALGLMLLTVGLLIAPSIFHRVTEGGESTGRTHAVAGQFGAAALLPFAVALGLDLAITLERVLGGSAWTAGAAGIGFALLALAGWYGAGEMMKRRTGATERRKAAAERDQREAAPLHARIEQMLTEARVILPGAQALLGFQLVIVLTNAFERLPMTSRLLHGAALLCVALAVILLITPAALHRGVWAGEDSKEFLRTGGWVTVAALVPLALGMVGDAYVVFTRITGSPGFGAVAASGVAAGLFGLWFAWPVAARHALAADKGV
jgi:uncharacterized protein DUF6328